MKKVVINACYGGFGLSKAAVKELIKMKSNLVKPTPIIDYFGDYKGILTIKDLKQELGFDNKPRYVFDGEHYHDKHMDYILFNNKGVYAVDCHDKESREHPDLIKVIETLGEHITSGSHAKLKIVEIPIDVEYLIDEYDGIETIRETHRTWR